MAHLVNWSDISLDRLCELRLNNYTYRDIVSKLEEEDLGKMSIGTLGSYLKSTEGINRLDSVRRKLSAEYKSEPLAEKFSRVHALVEQAVKLRRNLRLTDIQSKLWFQSSREFREYLKLIREEMEPLRMELTDNSVSMFEQWETIMTQLEAEDAETKN